MIQRSLLLILKVDIIGNYHTKLHITGDNLQRSSKSREIFAEYTVVTEFPCRRRSVTLLEGLDGVEGEEGVKEVEGVELGARRAVTVCVMVQGMV
jgi:hypothetical protein